MTVPTSVGRARRRARIARAFQTSTALSCSLFTAGALIGLPTAARAQTAAPAPPRPQIDANGVDLFNGTMNVDASKLVMGSGQTALTYYQLTRGLGWTDSFTATIDAYYGSTTATVVIGGTSEIFDLSGSTYTPRVADGSSLTLSGSIFTFTAPDGTVAHFDRSMAATYPYYASGGRVTDITRPSGERLIFTYYSTRYCAHMTGSTCTVKPYTYRVAKVRNSFGYSVAYTYSTNSFSFTQQTTDEELEDWSTPQNVTGSNLTASGGASPTQYFGGSVSGGYTYFTVTDPMSRTTTYRMSGNALMGIKLPAAASESITIAYTSGRVSSVTTPAGTTSYGAPSDVSGIRTVSVTDPLSHVTTYTFNIASQTMASMTVHRATGDPGFTTRWDYDASNRLTTTTKPEGDKVTLGYDSHGNVTSTTATGKDGVSTIATTANYPCTSTATCALPNWTRDAKGNQTDYTYDPTTGDLLTVTAPAPTTGAVRPQTRYSYTSYQAYFDPAGGTSYAASGEPVTMLTGVSTCRTTTSCVGTADETRTTVAYGPQTTGTGNNLLPVTQTIAAGDASISATTTAGYDAVGNLTSVDGPLSGTADTSHAVYDADREQTMAIGPDPDGAGALKNRAVQLTWSADGLVTNRATGTANADGSGFVNLQQVATTLDAADRPVMQVLSAGGTTYGVTQTQYDAAGRVACQVVRMNPANWTTPMTSCTPDATGPDRVTAYSYNTANEVTQVTSGYGTAAAANDASVTFTGDGRTATATDANGNVTAYTYDTFDRPYRTCYQTTTQAACAGSPGDYEQASAIDANGNVTSRRLRDGTSIGYTFDALNRMTYLDLSGSGIDQDITYSFDQQGRLTGSSNPSGHLSNYGYDALGRMVTEQTTYGGTKTSTYDAAGRRTRLTWPDTFYLTYNYDLANAVTAIKENGSTTLAGYAYDDLGRRTSLSRANGVTTSYGYDGASRLASLSHDLAGTSYDLTLGFTYNAASQIATRTSSNDLYSWADAANVDRSYTANGLNQYSAVGSVTPSYDARGNLTSAGGASYTYSQRDQLYYSSIGATLYYDPLSRLDLVYDGAANTTFDYDGDRLATEGTYGSSTVARRYVYGPGEDEPLVWYEGAGTTDRRWLLADERGSVIAVTDGAGNAIDIKAYDEYGAASDTTPANAGRFGYTGQAWLPALGLNYYKARMYSPTLGRFLQTDPIGYGDGLNWYNYVGSDPVNATDPSGLVANANPCPEPRIVDGVAEAVVCAPGGGSSGIPVNQSFFDSYLRLPERQYQVGLGTGPSIPVNLAPSVGAEVSSGEEQSKTHLAEAKVPKDFRTPTHAPQLPPTQVPEGWRVRSMPPNTNYPSGYWRLEKPLANGGWQGINPTTMKPGPQWDTHIPYPSPWEGGGFSGGGGGTFGGGGVSGHW